MPAPASSDRSSNCGEIVKFLVQGVGGKGMGDLHGGVHILKGF